MIDIENLLYYADFLEDRINCIHTTNAGKTEAIKALALIHIAYQLKLNRR